MNLLKVKTPWLAKKAFPSYIWDIPSHEKVIYLTFDDGPTPDITEKVLDILAQYNAKASFFCIGKNIAANPIIYHRIVRDDHAVGNHTYNHLKGWKIDNSTYLNDIAKTNEILNSNLFRPPYGKLKPSQGKALQKLGYKIIMWDVLTGDWNASISKEQVLQNIIKNTDKGSIIVLHDSLKAAQNILYALPKALDYFTKKGYVFKRIEI